MVAAMEEFQSLKGNRVASMKQKKSTKKFLKSAAKAKHGKEDVKPKKPFGKKKPRQTEEEMEVGHEENYINLKQPTNKVKKDTVKRFESEQA
jgi:hypothetical protein